MSLWILFQRWAVKHFTQLTGRNLLFALIGIIVNPTLRQEIRPEDTIYYIADERIRDFRWP